MNLYQEGDTIPFENKQYLVMKRVVLEDTTYLILAGEKDSFELFVCKVIEIEDHQELEKVINEDLKRKILFQMA